MIQPILRTNAPSKKMGEGPGGRAMRLRSSLWVCLLALASGACDQAPADKPGADGPAKANTEDAAPAASSVRAPEIPADPLPSWNQGATKQALLDFVARVTTRGRPEFVPPAERIATFDNDGTLWSEQPLYIQLAFALDRVRELAPKHPEWKAKEPFKSILAGDLKAAFAGGKKAVVELVLATHAGMTTDEFESIVKRWFATAKHPKYGRPYTECGYQPMIEVLEYLRANGFKNFIVSGGGIDFMRPIAEKMYGIPPEQVIGSYGTNRLELRDDKLVLQRLEELTFFDDGPFKVVAIQRSIGRRPIAAFGNSDGDLQMLEWTAAGSGPRFALIVRHTDDVREVAYDTSALGHLELALVEAKARGWTVVSMKDDWKTIFPPNGATAP